MPLSLVYRQPTPIPVEVEGLLPAAVRGLSPAEIERFEVFHGNRRAPLAEFFAVSGDAADGRLEFAGDLSGVHWIGARLAEGEIRVEGSAGRHLGSAMTGGAIHVTGDAGDWVGGEMRGGLIHVRGSAGNLLGAAYRGSKRGMTGGTILVHGPAGDEIGHSMRRGLLATGGAGDFAGLNMIAGTIFVFGPVGERTGAGMRRGTIGLFGGDAPRLLPTFRPGGRQRLLIVELLLRELARLGYPPPRGMNEAGLRTYHGDFVAEGRGEILVAEGREP